MTVTADDYLETRQSLVARLKSWDDHESWREFLKIYGRLIHSVASQAGLTEQEAQEAVQETIITVARSMPSFRYDPSVCSFKTWLRHLARKRIADQFRKRNPSNKLVTLPESETSSHTAAIERIPDPQSLDVDFAWNIEWQKNIFEAAVGRVKGQVAVEQFQIFDLYVLKNWPAKRVTSTLGVSMAQVYLAKHRVLGAIKREAKRLEKEGI
jgi:RNA polymerase sigma-70 factor (ECF subfamily)